MSLAVIWAWIAANEAALATILFFISELLGANPKFKSNGIVSFILIQFQQYLKKKGGEDLTP
jgi:hypothetical protein